MQVRTWWLMTAVVAGVTSAGIAAADPPPGDGPPVGLERLRKPDDKGKLPVDGEAAPSDDGSAPQGRKSLGHDPTEAPGYSPGKPDGGRSSDPGSIGGGTRVGGQKSPLDDIH